MKKQENTKKHADFQDSYRQSSNFNSSVKDEDFKIKKNGKLKLEKEEEKDSLEGTDKERINDALEGVKKHK
ncbi:hypothetical protein [Flavimarina sp. Hel_I_48]|uniref:hypothetical protein n=1 Tax=Flavimarina sp. Hel_I_48 TaxID=1392488 RepID=UPI0004DECEC0|nr:hypothetical protein [Flavimarina sp. Hel_I_48]